MLIAFRLISLYSVHDGRRKSSVHAFGEFTERNNEKYLWAGKIKSRQFQVDSVILFKLYKNTVLLKRK